MVSPENMVPKVNKEDFYTYTVDELTVYIHKDFVETRDEIEFLIPYFGKETISFQR